MNNLTILTELFTDNNYDFNNNPLLKLNENVIIFIEHKDYNYITKIRTNYENKTYLMIVSKENFINDKVTFIKKMIEVNPFKSNNFGWCDINYINTYLSKGFLPIKIKLSILTNNLIENCFLIDI